MEMKMSKTSKIRVLGFDPGLSHTGWNLSEIDIENGALNVVKLGEFSPSGTADKATYREESEKYGKRTISLAVLRETIAQLLTELKPDYIVMEDAFINPKRPMAYGALSMWHCTARMVARDVAGKAIIVIPAKSAKLGVSGRGDSGKVNIQQAVVTNPKIHFKNEKLMQGLTEHCADSIGLSYSFMTMYLPSIISEANAIAKLL
jgi:Holliday junction resolvasome RuvABC endonuclease subunit